MLKIIIFGIILCLITAFILLPKGKEDPSPVPSPSASTSPSVTVESLPKPSETSVTTKIPFLTDSFVKRQFDPKSKFVIGWGRDATPSADYPRQMIDVAEEQLQPMKCTQGFDPDKNNQFFYHDSKQNNQRFLVTPDKTFQEVLNKINSDIEPQKYGLYFFDYCLTEDNKMLIHYYRLGKDISQDNDPLDVFLLNVNGETKRVAINTGPAMYFSCKKPMLFTSSNELYFNCGGGDTTYYYSIYKIDFNNEKGTEILNCYQSEGDTYAQPNPPLVCK